MFKRTLTLLPCSLQRTYFFARSALSSFSFSVVCPAKTPSPRVCEAMLMMSVTLPGWYSICCYFNVLQIRFIHTDLLKTLLFSFLKCILIPLRIITVANLFVNVFLLFLLFLRIFLVLLLCSGFCTIGLPHLYIRYAAVINPNTYNCSHRANKLLWKQPANIVSGQDREKKNADQWHKIKQTKSNVLLNVLSADFVDSAEIIHPFIGSKIKFTHYSLHSRHNHNKCSIFFASFNVSMPLNPQTLLWGSFGLAMMT